MTFAWIFDVKHDLAKRAAEAERAFAPFCRARDDMMAMHAKHIAPMIEQHSRLLDHLAHERSAVIEAFRQMLPVERD